jgi:Family of unknown function (DUF5519)
MNIINLASIADLPQRQGPAPRVEPGPPQHQLDQLPTGDEWSAMRKLFDEWQSADKGASRRAVPGTVGLYIPENVQGAASQEAYLLGKEFAHHHPDSDGGLHLVLPPEWHAAALQKGWAIPHTFAGQPSVSRWTVLVFAPRDATERAVAKRLLEASEEFALGRVA